MKKLLFTGLLAASIIFCGYLSAEAKTKSLQDVEGDRIVVLKIDKNAKLPKAFLKGKEAQAYIGSFDDLKTKVTKNLYTGENVIRHERSPKYSNLSDAIIFNTGGGKIGYVHRKDGAYVVIINYPDGRKLKEVDEKLFDEYARVINGDCTVPYVFFDKDGKEAAIVYMPSSLRVYQYLTTDGLVAIDASEWM